MSDLNTIPQLNYFTGTGTYIPHRKEGQVSKTVALREPLPNKKQATYDTSHRKY